MVKGDDGWNRGTDFMSVASIRALLGNWKGSWKSRGLCLSSMVSYYISSRI